jgi:hypothetical protein
MALSAEERFDLIKENLGEVLNPELIESILKEGRNPRVYWGKGCPPSHVTFNGQLICALFPFSRYRYNWQASLRILRRRAQDCAATRRRM